MSYTSLLFFIFVIALIFVYYMVPKSWQWKVLLIANIIFYTSNGVIPLFFITATTLLTWIAAILLEKKDLCQSRELGQETLSREEKNQIKGAYKKQKKRILIPVLLMVFGLLAYAKYTNFGIGIINGIAGVDMIQVQSIIVPLGISFYTFMSVGYILDIYWKKYPAEHNFFKYATFTTFFPHVVQGPIGRYNKLAPQFFEGRHYDFRQMVSGFELFLWGLFQKLVIADRLGIFVNCVFANYEDTRGGVWFLTLAFYSIQTYADFSGCMDICRGISEILGIRLEKNFNHPYFAKTIPEFWQRWHISMGAWFKDYLFLPISNSSFVKKSSKKLGVKYGSGVRKKFAACFPVAIVWLATGVWHGAGWTFIFWGLFHGCLTIGGTIFAESISRLTSVLHIPTKAFWWKLFQMSRTFFLCCIGRIFFRAPDLQVAGHIIKNMTTDLQYQSLFNGDLFTFGLSKANMMIALVSIGILWSVSMLQERCSIREKVAKQNIVIRYALLYIAIFSILILGIYGPGYDTSTFIYNAF